MSVLNKFMSLLSFSDEDDDDDENEGYDDYNDEFEDEKPRRKLFGKKDEDDEDDVLDEDDEDIKPQRTFARRNKVVPMNTRNKGLEVCVIKPSSFDDTREITMTILDGKAVVVNLEGIHIELAQRIVDFLSGSSFAINGTLQKITNYIIIVTPPSVDVSGDLQELMNGGMDLSSLGDTRF